VENLCSDTAVSECFTLTTLLLEFFVTGLV